MRDQTPAVDFPRRSLTVLVLGAASYAVYRMIQTALIGDFNVRISAPDKLIVSAFDGAIMALLAPVALWASRTFPLVPTPRFRNLAAHCIIALCAAAGWIAALVVFYSLVTRTSLSITISTIDLSWLSSNLFAYSLLVAVVHLMSFQQRVRRGELHAALLQSQLSTARLETLKAQLHPHFLFNTLHTISELIHIDPNAADAMVIRLGRLLRLSLEYTADAEVSVDREFEVVRAYLDLHQMRHGDRLATHIHVDPAVRDALVPPMILQPLVENALRHGITRRLAPGKIWVNARRAGENLRLTVSDNGVGLPAEIVEGVGLRNTRTRLLQLYDHDQQFLLTERSGGGVEAVIELPLRFIETVRHAERADASAPRWAGAAPSLRPG
jgi:two-component sensor histidine kinase